MAKTNSKLEQTVSEVEAVLEAMLKSEADALKAKVEKCGDMTQKGEEAPAPVAKDEASMSPPDQSPAPEASAEASASPQADDPAMQEQPATQEELEAAYCQLSPEELEMHEKALQAAKAKCAASAPAAEGSAPPAAEAPAPAEGSPPVDPKAEMAFQKSEKIAKDFEELQKSVQLLTQAVTAIVKVPQRKAVTANDVVPVQEQKKAVEKLSKAEVNEKLKAVVTRDDLTRKDRDLLNRYFKQQANVSDLAHLLQ